MGRKTYAELARDREGTQRIQARWQITKALAEEDLRPPLRERLGTDGCIAGMTPFKLHPDRKDEFMFGIDEKNVYFSPVSKFCQPFALGLRNCVNVSPTETAKYGRDRFRIFE